MSENCECVRVAVNIRPLVTNELVMGCTDCVTVYPSESQVQIGSHAFTFDYVFGSKCSPSTYIFEECVAPLVDALFHGYNGTVLAYGQTGSGKTYTMGTNYNGDEHKGGVIPNVMEAIFSKVESMKNSTDFLIRVSFIEIFKEEVFDLLGKTGGPGRIPIQIRERINGEIALAGVTEAEVRTKEEMSSYLQQGSLSRATGSTNMNHQSSRSHAIFTISMEQKRINSSAGDGIGDDVLIAKLHLVDLAGSERAKRTGADGKRLQEGIHINKGLLALGNVISSLGDEKKRKEGGHVPYRDSKLTRILQDSLGGNSKTVMIACISPADTNAEETLNTLKYANRARNIQNKAVVNRDPMGAQLQRMRSQIEELQAELLYYRGNSTAPAEDIKIMKQKISLLEASNTELKGELHKSRLHFEHMSQRVIDAQVERDRLLMKIQSVQNGNPLNEADAETEQNLDLLKGYITKIQELEGEIMRIQNSSGLRREISVGYLDFEEDGCHSRDSFLIDSVPKDVETDGVVEDVEKELEHSSLQQKLDCELKELDKKLEQKEAEMKKFANTDTSILKQHYEKKLHELELEKRDLLKEIDTLRQNYANICSNSDDSAQKLKEEYLQKLNALECQVAELKKKQDAQAQLLRQKQKSDEAGKRLLDEIQRIKTQKVQLQQKIKQESEQFRLWKASREKEVLQLKKEGRRNEYEMHKLLALNQRQKLVLQRKTEEATMATKRLKELLDSRKASRETLGSNKGPGTQALVKTIENELELIVSKHQVQSEYDRQLKERAKWAEELARLKGKTLSEFPESMSPGARNSRIFALENMLSTSSSHIVSMGSHLSEADERERAFNGRGRWNHVHSLAEAKNIMNFLFNLASSSRCQLSDMEFECREKDSEIRDLKEKVVHLVRQIEIQRVEFNREKTLVMLTLERQSKEVKGHSKIPVRKSSEGHVYDRKPKDSHSSAALNGGVFRSVEDMDTSDDDYHTDDSYAPNKEDSDSDWVLTRDRKKRQARRKTIKPVNQTVINLDPEDSPEKDVCCSCSKSSSCKTPRCECRASGRNCTEPCGCVLSKCSNRIEACKKDDAGNESFVDSCSDLANHGAALLQAALSEKPNTTTEAASTRKPLSDIGNNMATTGAGKGGPRKKWRAPVIQLVPSSSSSLPPNPQVQNAEAPPQHAKSKEEDDIPLKLPRAMRSALSTNNNQLSESDQYDESANKETNASPRQAKPKSGKENMGL